MTNKTYNQYCAIAHALDIVGERWTLLIVRNLLTGPKRFSDLMKGLPGISTNILTDRLKALEGDGVVTNRYMPPPAASTVYELTALGLALAAPIGALARWGALSFKAPQPGQKIVPESIAFMILGMFWRDQAMDLNLICRVHVIDEHYDHNHWVCLGAAGVEFTEANRDSADITIQLALEPLLRLSSGQMSLRSAIDAGLIQLEGDQHKIDELIAWVDTI